MKRVPSIRARVLWIALFICSTAAADPSKPFPARLDAATSHLQAAIDQRQYAGAVMLVARRGRIVQWQALGFRDVARTTPMRPDAIFQIYSMTKPITSAAALVLMEEDRLSLEDPVSRFIPEFARLPAARPITVRHLLTHTAGLAAGPDLDDSPSLEAYAVSVSQLPLATDPGTRFSYDGVSTEILSRVIEVAAGMPFDKFISTRLLAPLGMVDTGFTVPHDKRDRIVEMSTTDEDGRLVTAGAAQNPAGDMLKRYPSGAGGLYSTAGDYARFCQMLLNGGDLEGVRILRRKTVELMLANQLTHLSPPVNEFSDAEGFGFGGYVVLDPARRGQPGSIGQFGWSGAAATWFTIDPREELIAILMMQHLPRGLKHDPPRLGRPFYNLVYQALNP
jgi:CubicO group peptidase (beta-lactamase class C family)